jgi:hypothetical protein
MRKQLCWMLVTTLLCACTPSFNRAISTSHRVLFIQRDHIPDTGYPHSRIYDEGTNDITAFVSSHSVLQNVKAIRGEGISQIRVSAITLKDNIVIAKCTPLSRSGCILPSQDQAKVQPGDEVACVVVRQHANGGRLASVCDRNFFHNGPGPGSDLDQVDNRTFARNLFTWLLRK